MPPAVGDEWVFVTGEGFGLGGGVVIDGALPRTEGDGAALQQAMRHGVALADLEGFGEHLPPLVVHPVLYLSLVAAHTLQVLEVFGALVFDSHRLEVLPLEEELIPPILAHGKDTREVARIVEDLPALVRLSLEALLEALVEELLPIDGCRQPVDALPDEAPRGLAPVLEVERAIQLDVRHISIEELHILLPLQGALLGDDGVYLPLDFGTGGDLVAQRIERILVRPLPRLAGDPVARPVGEHLAVGLVEASEVGLDELGTSVLGSRWAELIAHRLIQGAQRTDLVMVVLHLPRVTHHPEELPGVVGSTAQRLGDELRTLTLPDGVAYGVGARGIEDDHHHQTAVVDRLGAPLLVGGRLLVVELHHPAVVHPVAHRSGGLGTADGGVDTGSVFGLTLAPCLDEEVVRPGDLPHGRSRQLLPPQSSCRLVIEPCHLTAAQVVLLS